ncbi:MAG TPA: pyridoxamine 5'-phosphate oxidase family protein, partial [Vicinamibacteria bacterium]|nr:pyridoxamine 5'-phosphate oxidase family protein [Vicinamibacteria bacterium]
MRRRPVVLALLLAALPCSAAPPAAPPAAPDRGRVLAAARELMQKARYCTLVTLAADGQPQARVVDPFAPEDELTVWIATNVLTRKVEEIKRDARVTLLYFDQGASAYVTLIGRAELVVDPAEKAKRWKPDWAAFYKDRNRGEDYLLIRVRP